MSHQGNSWEKEYRNPKLVTLNDGPQKDTLRFLKFLKKEEDFEIVDRNIVDLGCGTGRNSNYLAEKGNNVIGIEISKTAINVAITRARNLNVKVDYRIGDIGTILDIADESVDIILDVTSSNSLNERGRDVYLKESHRILKDGRYFFVRALCKDGNKNVKNLLKQNPGQEYDTYIIKEIGLTERVFSKKDFINLYSKYFKIRKENWLYYFR